MFELLPTKLPHYVLPAYPALALLCAAALIDAFETPLPRLLTAARALAIAGIIALVAITAALVTLLPGDADADMRRAVSAAIVGAIVLVSGGRAHLRRAAPGDADRRDLRGGHRVQLVRAHADLARSAALSCQRGSLARTAARRACIRVSRPARGL